MTGAAAAQTLIGSLSQPRTVLVCTMALCFRTLFDVEAAWTVHFSGGIGISGFTNKWANGFIRAIR